MNIDYQRIRSADLLKVLRYSLSLLFISVLLTSCKKKDSPPDDPASSTTIAPSKPKHQAERPKYECLMQDGIPTKVIIKSPDARAFESFDFTGTNQPLKFFRKYFVFNETDRAYLVGDETLKRSRIGWVNKRDAIRWDTSQAIYFVNKKEQDKPVSVKVWVSRQDVGNLDKPHFESDLTFKATSEPFPVLAKDGDAVEIAILWDVERALASITTGGSNQIANLLPGEDVRRAGSTDMPTPRPIGKMTSQIKSIKDEAKRMDIVLVIDVTGSMGPYIDKVRDQMLQIVDKLENIKGPESEIHVGVVAYRDYGEKFIPGSFITRPLPLTTNFTDVRQFLRELEAKGSDLNPYWDEAVFDGLAEAATSTMNWGGDHAFKFICLTGDAGPHDGADADIQFLEKKGYKVASPFWGVSLDQGLEMIHKIYSEKNIQIYTFSVGTHEPSHIAFQRIANNNEHALNLSDSDAFISALENELTKAKQARDDAVELVTEIVDQKKDASTLDDDQRRKLVLVGVTNAEVIQQMAQERIQRGWLAPDEDSSTTLCVYVKRSELQDYQLQLVSDLSRKLNGGLDTDTLKRLLAPAVPDSDWATADEIIKGSAKVFYGNSVVSLPSLTMNDTALVNNMRKKNNQILILLATEKLFNNNEEGWVPLSQLPVSR